MGKRGVINHGRCSDTSVWWVERWRPAVGRWWRALCSCHDRLPRCPDAQPALPHGVNGGVVVPVHTVQLRDNRDMAQCGHALHQGLQVIGKANLRGLASGCGGGELTEHTCAGIVRRTGVVALRLALEAGKTLSAKQGRYRNYQKYPPKQGDYDPSRRLSATTIEGDGWYQNK